MTISEIVWDMDGTIIDSAESVPDAFMSAVEELREGSSIEPRYFGTSRSVRRK